MADIDEYGEDSTSGSGSYGAGEEEMLESDKLTFDEMVSFTMFAEFLLVGLCMGLFLAHFVLSRF